ncbi:MAG: hypothetical protein RIQ61_645 [Bacteroidota bacterium]|jgi:hypothetical protein
MRFCYIVFILFYCSSAFAQSFQLDGIINIAGTSSKYSLSLNRIAEKIEGFSYANVGTEDETKCSIVGTIDTVKEIIYLKEVDIVYTKSKLPYQQFCMLAITLKKSNQKNLITYKGTCKGYLYKTQSLCTSGYLTLADQPIAAEKIKELLTSKDTPIVKQIGENQLPSGLSTNERNQNLFQNDIHKLHCNSSSILLTIQDNNEMDYDKIAIEVNNDMILSNYTLSKQAKQLSIPLKSEHTLIKICALNEGNSAPNTAFINIQSTSWSKSFISNLSTDACTTIDIKKD